MNMSLLSTARRRGFTLIELAIVMGIIGSIISAIWWAASNANDAKKENAAVTQLQTVAQNIATLFMGSAIPTCTTEPNNVGGNRVTSCMINAGAIPKTYIDLANTATVDNPWSLGTTAWGTSGFSVYAISTNPPNPPRIFRLSFYNLSSRKDCLALVSAATSCQAGQLGCPIAAYTAGTSEGLCAGGTALATTGLPAACAAIASPSWQTATATLINTLCGENTYPSGNSVEFDYQL